MILTCNKHLAITARPADRLKATGVVDSVKACLSLGEEAAAAVREPVETGDCGTAEYGELRQRCRFRNT